MAKPTKQQCIIAGLEALGQVRVEDPRLSKYIKFRRTLALARHPETKQVFHTSMGKQDGPEMFFFVSARGYALHTGPTSTNAYPTPHWRDYLVMVGVEAIKAKGKPR